MNDTHGGQGQLFAAPDTTEANDMTAKTPRSPSPRKRDGKRRETAESMAKRQREISVSEHLGLADGRPHRHADAM